MLIKTCGFLVILIGLLMAPALAEINLQPSGALHSSESNITKDDGLAIDNGSISAAIMKLPISFIENQGQALEEAKFMAKTSQATIYFLPSEVQFTLASQNNTSIIRMTFEGAEPVQLGGEELLPGMANFFIGNDSSKWLTDIPTYSSVKYESLYPGIDLIFKGSEGNLKHELLIGPGADPAKIVLLYSGQDGLMLEEDGSIRIKTSAGNLTDSAPVCYQDINGSKVAIEADYRFIDDSRIGFDIKSYDRSLPLVIDPVLRYSTYLGGSSLDICNAIAVDDGEDNSI